MTNSNVAQAVVDASITRALEVLYRAAALSMADPRVGGWSRLADTGSQELIAAAAALLRDDPATQPERLGWGERPANELQPSELFATLPRSSDALNAAHEALFGLLVSGDCPPYETEYIDSKFTFQRSQALADIAGFYHAFGWTPSRSHPDRPDHVALELEFMATLCGMELRTGDSEQAEVCRTAQAKFLSEHLAWWVPALARLLVRADPYGFHGAVGRIVTALLPMHRAVLGVPAPIGPASPAAPLERPEECEGCLLQPSELG